MPIGVLSSYDASPSAGILLLLKEPVELLDGFVK